MKKLKYVVYAILILAVLAILATAIGGAYHFGYVKGYFDASISYQHLLLNLL